MRYFLSFTVISVLCVISLNGWSLNLTATQKYPYSVLTSDYGILKQKDLDFSKSGIKSPPFLPKEGFGYIYWQCFPRQNISIILEDTGESSEDFGWKDNIGEILIRVFVTKGVFHEYSMRRNWTTGIFQHEFNHWLQLMKGQPYVCLAGSFVDRTKTIENGIERDVSGWIFDRLKTKKGCVAYVDNNCD